MSRMTAPEGDVTIPIRLGSLGSARFARIEQPLARQSFLQVFEGELQRSQALRLEGLDDELIFAADFVGREIAARDDGEPVARLKPAKSRHPFIEHALELAPLVLQAKVVMAAGRKVTARDFASHPDGAEIGVKQALQGGVQLAHAIDLLLALERELHLPGFSCISFQHKS